MIAILYVGAIAVINVGFEYAPLLMLPDGGAFPVLSLVAGAVFVLRDMVQRRHGNIVLVTMTAGCILSFILARPEIALASSLAFAVSELADWLVYSHGTGSMARRVLLSSAVSTPVDTVLFLTVAFGPRALSPLAIALMVAAKMVSACVVAAAMRGR